DQRHRGVVTLAEAELEDAQVAAVARLVARAELVEELHHHVAVAQAVEREAPVGEGRGLAERDDGLGHAAQLLRLRQRGADGLVLEERDGHVAQHRESMAAGAVELAKPVAVTHCGFLSVISWPARPCWYCGLMEPDPRLRGDDDASGAAARRMHRHFVSPATGQFSSFMPSVRPFEASTSLISFSDLRPRFGVFSSSF